MKRLLLKFIFGFVMLPAAIGAAFFSLEKNGFFNIEQLEVVLQQMPESRLYLQPLVKKLDKGLESYRGRSLWDIDIVALEKQISAEKWIQTVTLTRRFPSQIQVVIQPKEIIFLLALKNSKLIPVVSDGTLLDPVDSRLAPDVPLVIGEEFSAKIELRKKAVQALGEIPLDGSFSRKSIAEIRFDAKEGFWMTMVKDGIKVKLGEDQLSLKSARVSQVIDYVHAHEFDARVIDANLSKKVLVRLRKDP